MDKIHKVKSITEITDTILDLQDVVKSKGFNINCVKEYQRAYKDEPSYKSLFLTGQYELYEKFMTQKYDKSIQKVNDIIEQTIEYSNINKHNKNYI